MFELDNGETGANAIDQTSITNPEDSSPDDWAQNNLGNLGNCPDGVNSCGYVSGPNVNAMAPGGSAFRSLFIQDPNGDAKNDDIFTEGSKDDLDVSTWDWTSGSTPNKDDLLPVGAAAYLNGDLLIYLYGTLFAPNGDASIGAWLFKKNIGKCSDGTFGVVDDLGTCLAKTDPPAILHENGDVFVVAQNTNGGRKVNMAVYQWVGNFADPDGACTLDLDGDGEADGAVNGTLCLVAADVGAACSGDLADDDFCGTMNLGAITGKDAAPGFATESPDDWGYQAKLPEKSLEQPAAGAAKPTGTDGIGSDDFPPTTLFEAGFNFSNLFPNEVGCFNSFLMNTRASQSVDAALKDLAIGKFPLCGISVDKTGDLLGKVGDDATYTFTITNTGAITLYLDTIVDDVIDNVANDNGVMETAALNAGCASLAPSGQPGDSCTFEVDYEVQPGDPDQLINVVEVHYNSASDLSGDDQSASDDHLVDLFQPSITLDKAGDGLSKVGDEVTYVITLNNTSSPDTPDLECTITDALLGLDEAVTLASGESHVINHPFVVPDGASDPLLNTASASCSPIGFENVFDADDGHSVNLFQPSVTIDKTANTELSKIGDPVDYTITVTNTSSDDSPDLDCTVTDALLGINEAVSLASGANHVINASRTVQSDDPDPLVNTASVTCLPQGFPNVLDDSDSHSVELFQPSIALDKTGDELSKVGDLVNYVITLSNTSSGDSPDLDCTVTDALLGINEAVSLISGANHVINASRTVQEGDPDPLPNTAFASCSPQGFPNVLDANASHNVNLFQPSVTIDKDANCELGVVVGEDITYTYTITNTGSPDSPDLVLASISDTVLDDLAADAILAGCDSLVSGASCQFTKVQSTSVVTPDPLINTVNVLYHPTPFENRIEASATESCDLIPPDPARVVIEKVLLNGEGQVFDYDLVNMLANSIPTSALQLTPLIGQVPFTESPFDDQPVGASDGFATTGLALLEVEIPDITQSEQASVSEVLPLPAFFSFVGLECRAAEGRNLTGVAYSGDDLETAELTLRSGDFAFCRYVNAFNPGDEGCTPGFWKQDFHFGHWPDPYLPIDHDGELATRLNEVFDFPDGFAPNSPRGKVEALGSDTMLEALNYGGGDKLVDKARILLRAAVAAVLNAAHPDVQFSFTEAQVIALVSAQLQTGTADSMVALATELDNANNGVFEDINGGTESCPLSGQLFLE